MIDQSPVVNGRRLRPGSAQIMTRDFRPPWTTSFSVAMALRSRTTRPSENVARSRAVSAAITGTKGQRDRPRQGPELLVFRVHESARASPRGVESGSPHLPTAAPDRRDNRAQCRAALLWQASDGIRRACCAARRPVHGYQSVLQSCSLLQTLSTTPTKAG